MSNREEKLEESRPFVFSLETNCTAITKAEVWKCYIMKENGTFTDQNYISLAGGKELDNNYYI